MTSSSKTANQAVDSVMSRVVALLKAKLTEELGVDVKIKAFSIERQKKELSASNMP